MKKLFFTLSLFLGFAALVNAQAVMGPKIQFEKMEANYGTIDYDSDPVREVKFKNVGTEPLLITNATGSCGCTVPEYPKSPIMPGKEGSLKIKYDTKREGAFTKTVTVVTNEPDSDNKHVINVTGTVKPNKGN
jgi:hypothetical protein